MFEDYPETPDCFPAAAALRLLAEAAPEAAAVAVPFVERLFAALARGDTAVYLGNEEAQRLAQAAPVAGNGPQSPLVLQGRRLMLAKYWQQERDLAREILRLSAAPVMQPEHPPAKLLADWFADEGSRDQQAAAALALLQNFILISGGPGTGKTTTVAKLLALLHREPAPRTALCAPTGKAAARLTESLHRAAAAIPDLTEAARRYLAGLQGQTAHRLLGLAPPQMQPAYHAHNPLPLDILLVDEASMLDNHLLLQLLSALPSGCRTVLLGDAGQLPAVGAGAVLSALSQGGGMQPETEAVLRALLPERDAFPLLAERHARLTVSHRFGADSGIGSLARAVQSGDGVAAWQMFARFPDVLHAEPRHPDKLVRRLYREHAGYWRAIDAGNVQAAFAAQAELAVLTALRSDADSLNAAYRSLLQEHGRARADTLWYAGRVVMVSRNAPAQHLYNGDIGIIMQSENGEDADLRAWFADADGFRSVPLSRLPEHETAFAITTHKSQGSEYGSVWFAAPAQAAYGRALLYTAVTRAKRQFAYWGSGEGFQAACAHAEIRRSALAQFLAEEAA